MAQHGSSLCHHVVHDGNSFCVVVFNGVQYYMPDNISAEYDATVPAGKALVLPAAINTHGLAPQPASKDARQVCRPSPSHLILGCHAMALAAVQQLFCAKEQDAAVFRDRAVENAMSVTPLGAYMVDELLTPRNPRNVDVASKEVAVKESVSEPTTSPTEREEPDVQQSPNSHFAEVWCPEALDSVSRWIRNPTCIECNSADHVNNYFLSAPHTPTEDCEFEFTVENSSSYEPVAVRQPGTPPLLPLRQVEEFEIPSF